MSRLARLLPVRAAVLGGMYLIQGLVYGFAGLVLLPALARTEVDVGIQGAILALGGAPWVFKLVLAPVIDRPGGRWGAAHWATAASVVLAAVLGLFALVPTGGSMLGFALAWLATNVVLAFQDVATDALAFDLLAPHERGRATTVMLGAHHLGAEGLAGAWIGRVAARSSIGHALALMALLTAALATLPASMIRSARRTRARTGLSAAVRAVLDDPLARRTLVLTALVFAADVGTAAVNGELLVGELGWTPDEIATRIPMPLLVASLAGYIVAIPVIDRLGHRRVTAVATVALGLLWIGFALARPAWASVDVFLAFVVAQALATSMLYAGVHALLLDATHPELRASQLAVMTATLNLPRLWAPLVAGALVGGTGLAGWFAICGAWQIAMVLVLPRSRDALRAA